ncbi:MAG: citryl-CoA lyase, partial [Anaerolineales bacterium]|nr:citryl-CoA lyase [Anaerolineales bacterium]
MTDQSWKTSITEIKPNEVRLRGYRIDELMGSISFAEAVYLALKGELPSADVARMMNAILVSSIDHGASPPSALAARTVASTGAPLNAAVAAGILSINRHHGGAIEDCMKVLQTGINRVDQSGETIENIAADLVAEFKASGKRIAGLGHRIHTGDPRTAKLFKLAQELGIAADGIQMINAIQLSLKEAGKALPINVDGAIAAVLVDLDIPSQLANAMFFIARVPGLILQAHEEQTRERPMRRIHPTEISY